ncbi:MAG: gluconokinase [Terriglobales bacterium]
MSAAPQIILVMGVSGSGKTTVGRLLANRLGCAFLEGDTLHPAANITKMSNGIPLDDTDRAPWLAAIRQHLETARQARTGLVVACSALKQRYRDFLAATGAVRWVYLYGSPELLRSRLEARHGHYMHVNMLASQLADLEPPRDAIAVDITPPPEEIVEQVLAALGADATGVAANPVKPGDLT